MTDKRVTMDADDWDGFVAYLRSLATDIKVQTDVPNLGNRLREAVTVAEGRVRRVGITPPTGGEAAPPVNERTSIDAFRATMPMRVDGHVVCMLVGWIPGDDSAYATGVIVAHMRGGLRPGSPYSTHVLVWAYDNPGRPWILQEGRYGYADFEGARNDAELRARQSGHATLL